MELNKRLTHTFKKLTNMKQITAKFNSKCTETGKVIRKGESMIYDYSCRKCYCSVSATYLKFIKVSDNNSEADNIRGYIEAQENAYCDNRYQY